TKPADKKGLKEILICGLSKAESKAGVARGTTVATYINKARDIANTPACDMTPTEFGKSAKALATATKLEVKVLGEKEIKKLKM
ncbi:hypothetical protein JHR55_09385, partial [Campylobacter jejuni]|uniref:hypothetical protein n=1 Tax=Campylobacter jejuni TaxID=197 RepID=UPI001E4E7675